MNFRPRILPALVFSALAVGCASFPDPEEQPTLQTLSDETVSGWESMPPITHRYHRQAAELMSPGRLPDAYYDLPISLSLSSRISIEEVAKIIEMSGIPVALATAELAEMSAFIPRYEGPVGPLLDSLSTISGLSFTWASGVLVIDTTSPYLLRIPQNEDIGKAIAAALASMKAVDVQVSKEAGLVSFRASQRDRARIESYLDRLSVNTSMVNLQIAVMNVTLDEDQRRGLDWSNLTLDAGELGLLEGDGADFLVPDDMQSGGGNDDDDSSSYNDRDGNNNGDGDGDGVSASDVTGAALRFAGGNAGLILKKGDINLQAVLNMLSTYGESRTVQNLNLKTLSGVDVELRSGESIPYVEELSLNVNEGTTSSGSNVETVDIGFDVNALPYYDAEDQLVTIELDLSMKSLVGWEELLVGRDGEKLRHPRIAEQSIGNIARLAAGETALVGGLIYESVTDNRTNLTGLERLPIGSKALVTTHNALFILMRPTVVVYGPRQVTGGTR